MCNVSATRAPRFAGLAVLIATSVGMVGCTSTHEVAPSNPPSDKSVIDKGVRELDKDLREMPWDLYVETKSEDLDDGFRVTVGAAATSFSEEQVLTTIRRVAATCLADVFVHQSCSLDLVGVDDSRFVVYSFRPGYKQIAADVHYAFAVARAAGGVPTLSISTGSGWRDGGGPEQRAVGVANPAANIHWDELRAVPDHSDPVKRWEIAGLSGTGPFPPAAVTDLFAGVSSVVATSDYDDLADDYLAFNWDGDDRAVTISITSKGFTKSLTSANTPLWPDIVAILKRVVEAGVPASVEYWGTTFLDDEDTPTAEVHLRPCAYEVPLYPEDQDMFAAAEAAGVDFPGGSGPGRCERS